MARRAFLLSEEGARVAPSPHERKRMGRALSLPSPRKRGEGALPYAATLASASTLPTNSAIRAIEPLS